MRKASWLIAVIGLLALTSSGGGPKVGDAFDGETNRYEGVSMTIVEGTPRPGGVTVEVLNTTDEEIDSGNAYDFGLQIEQDGRWYWLESKGEEANTAEAYIYAKDEPRELELAWGRMYGSLKPGHYRVTKQFFEYRGPGDSTDFLLTAEFTLE